MRDGTRTPTFPHHQHRHLCSPIALQIVRRRQVVSFHASLQPTPASTAKSTSCHLPSHVGPTAYNSRTSPPAPSLPNPAPSHLPRHVHTTLTILPHRLHTMCLLAVLLGAPLVWLGFGQLGPIAGESSPVGATLMIALTMARARDRCGPCTGSCVWRRRSRGEFIRNVAGVCHGACVSVGAAGGWVGGEGRRWQSAGENGGLRVMPAWVWVCTGAQGVLISRGGQCVGRRVTRSDMLTRA